MASVWRELKRRNVVRVALAYAAVAWLVLQIADVILNNLEAPGWIFRAILLLLGIGFLLTLAFAWAYELTPEGIKKESEIDRAKDIGVATPVGKLNFLIIGAFCGAVVICVHAATAVRAKKLSSFNKLSWFFDDLMDATVKIF